jgi:hypothetical protein
LCRRRDTTLRVACFRVARRLLSGVEEPSAIGGVRIVAGVDTPPFDAEQQAKATAAP